MMSKQTKEEYLNELKKKYRNAFKKEKTRLLDDFCDFTGNHRKYVITLINAPKAQVSERKEREKVYNQDVKNHCVILWKAAGEICAERLHPFIPSLLEKLIECNEIRPDKDTKEKLLCISLGTLKNILGNEKERTFVKITGTTKPGSLLKSQIAVRYALWTETDPGWCEVDTVSHCGDDPSGEFISSLNMVDISSGWSEQVAIWGKGELATQEAIDEARNALSFFLLGLDSDNGSEFINWHLFRYCKKEKITFTRGRPYKKNDNAHVEQKNYTAIRQLVGYERLDKKEQLDILNDLYRNEWRLYINFFQPTMKLKEKIKDTKTGKTKRKYFKAKTPYQRLMEHPKIAKEQKKMLESTYKRLNPIKLQSEIERKIKLLEKTLR